MSKTGYAFLINSEEQTPENYYTIFETDSFSAGFYGVKSIDMACDTAERLAAGGVSIIDLCGDFDEETAGRISKAAGGSCDISYARYSVKEMNKLESLEEYSSYGIIIMSPGFVPLEHSSVLESDEFKTSIVCVSTVEQACNAAQRMEREGINFIELCSGFGEAETKLVIDSVDGRMPVGSAGIG